MKMEHEHMRETIFNTIKDNLNRYKYSSMIYTDYEDICDYEIIFEADNLILLYGYNNTAKMYEYHWAANSAKDIVDRIEKEQCFITFIPYEWVTIFENTGFSIRNAWHDYFKKSLSDISNEANDAMILKCTECKEASEVTISCRNQSRGFTGETEEFMKKWLSNTDENNRHSTIFIEKNDIGEIIGLVCTSVYGYDSEKGPVSWIREVCVRPDFQNRGIARRLIMQALSHGKQKGARRAFLAADEVNKNAIHLYESIGFEPTLDDSQIDMIRKEVAD